MDRILKITTSDTSAVATATKQSIDASNTLEVDQDKISEVLLASRGSEALINQLDERVGKTCSCIPSYHPHVCACVWPFLHPIVRLLLCVRHTTLALLQAKASRQLQRRERRSSGVFTEEHYASFLTLRSVSVSALLANAPLQYALQITSIGEGRLLSELGLPKEERNQIVGLQIRRFSAGEEGDGLSLTKEQISARAIVRLAANPPPRVGLLQRRTAKALVRPYPLGLRFSGKNMSPLPSWLAGCQHVAMNMSTVDLPIHFHFALFHGSGGYVLKPPEMLDAGPQTAETDQAHDRPSSAHDDVYWPPPRQTIQRTTIAVLSLHNLPKARALSVLVHASCAATRLVI